MKENDCISRKRAIERLKLNLPISQGADNSRDRHRYMQAMADIQAIRELPSVTPQEPRKGHWIGNYQVDFGEWQEYDVKLSDGNVTDNCHCSECDEELLSGDRGMFCPYCGADMRISEENDV